MKKEGNINELEHVLDLWAKKIIKPCLLIGGTIIEVDETNYTCTVLYEDGITEKSNVPLKVLIGDKASIIEIPKINTDCQILFRDNNINAPQIFSIHESEKILIDCNNIVFNGGSLDGLPKINQLITELNNRSERENAIVSALTNLASACTSSGTTPLTGASMGTLITTAIANILTPVVSASKSTLENTKIKQ